MSKTVNVAAFWRKMKRILRAMKNPNFRSDKIFLCFGDASDDVLYSKIKAIQYWLFGWMLPDTVCIIDKESMHIWAPERTMKHLIHLPRDDAECKVVLHERKEDDDIFNEITTHITGDDVEPKIGRLKKMERETGEFAGKVWEYLEKEGKGGSIKLVEISSIFTRLFVVKDTHEVSYIKKASTFTSQVLLSHLIPAIEDAVDQQKKVTHEELSEKTEEVLSNNPSAVGSSLKKDDIDSCYLPIIQSGTNFDLAPTATPHPGDLEYGVIICSLGASVSNYCSNVSRTLLFRPSEGQKEAMALLINIHSDCIARMRSGVELNTVYQTALDAIKRSNHPGLVANFIETMGFSMGIEFRESTYMINKKNKRKIAKGMVFNFRVGFNDITVGSEKPYSLLLADTISITGEGAEILTTDCKVDNTYDIDEDGNYGDNLQNMGRKKRDATKLEDALVIKERQRNLIKKRMEEKRQRVREQENKIVNCSSYDTMKDMPFSRWHNKLYLDEKHNAVLCPILKQSVPFHISTVKKVEIEEGQGGNFTAVIKFWTPTTTSKNRKFPKQYLKSQYIEELRFRGNTEAFRRTATKIEEFRKQKEAENKVTEREQAIAQQEKLQSLPSGNSFRLRELMIKPAPSRKKSVGYLQIFSNGIRYKTMAQQIDLAFANIRYAYFEPASKGVLVLLHFHLYNPVLSGKKATKDFQFYVQIGDVSDDVTTHSTYDEESGYHEDREELRQRKKWNTRFKSFAMKIQEISKKYRPDNRIKFEVALEEAHNESFFGCPQKESVRILLLGDCIVSLSDNPPFVLALSDIEVCSLERVDFALSQFEAVFIHKDLKTVVEIGAIPRAHLTNVQNILTKCDVPFYENRKSIKWKIILEDVASKDTEVFIELGGWDHYLVEAQLDQAQIEMIQEEMKKSGAKGRPMDDEYIPSSDEEADSDEYQNSEDEEHGESSEGEEVEDSKSWAELDKIASESDRKKIHARPIQARKKAPARRRAPTKKKAVRRVVPKKKMTPLRRAIKKQIKRRPPVKATNLKQIRTTGVKKRKRPHNSDLKVIKKQKR